MTNMRTTTHETFKCDNKTRQTKASQCYLPEQRAATPTTASSIAQSEQNIYVYHSIKIILLSGWQTSLTLLFCVLPLHFFVLYYIKSYLFVYMFWITKSIHIGNGYSLKTMQNIFRKQQWISNSKFYHWIFVWKFTWILD